MANRYEDRVIDALDAYLSHATYGIAASCARVNAATSGPDLPTTWTITDADESRITQYPVARSVVIGHDHRGASRPGRQLYDVDASILLAIGPAQAGTSLGRQRTLERRAARALREILAETEGWSAATLGDLTDGVVDTHWGLIDHSATVTTRSGTRIMYVEAVGTVTIEESTAHS